MLPSHTNAFVGRRADLRRLEHAVRTPGSVTLIGPPGAGKTRLALQVAGTFRGETRFVDLTRARSLAEVLVAVASVVRVQLSGPESGWVDQLGAAIEPGLVVLDNCEQAVDAVRVAVDAWSSRGATILATSRICLDAAAERVVEIGPLSEADGTTLLVTRAREAGIDVAEDDAARTLVDALDALPLAIELVAARCRVLSTTRIRERLSGDGLHGVDEAIATSWELASPAARSTLAQVAVFRGAFDLEAAEGVVRLESGTVLDAVDELVRSSLVARSADGPAVRFRLLEIVRAFALGRGLKDEVADRHFRYLDDRYGHRTDADDPGWVDELAVAADDIRAAHERALDRDPDAACRLALSLRPQFQLRGPYVELLALVDASLARDLSAALRAHAVHVRASVRRSLGERQGLLEEVRLGQDFARAAGDQEREVRLIVLEGLLLQDGGASEPALERLRSAATLADRSGKQRLRAHALDNIGKQLMGHDLKGAAAAFQEAADLYRVHGPPQGVAHALMAIGEIQDRSGDPQAARAAMDQAIAIYRDKDWRSANLARALHIRGYHLLMLGRHGPAEADLREALDLYREIGTRMSIGEVSRKLGLLALDRGDLRQAEELLREALVEDTRSANRASESQSLVKLGLVQLAGGRLAEAAATWRAALDQIRAMGIRGPNLLVGLLAIAERGHEAELTETRLAYEEARESPHSRGILALASGVVSRRNGEPWEADLALARAQAPFTVELRVLLRAIEAPPGIRLVARWDSVQVHRLGLPPTALSGVSARIVSELVAVGAPVGWEVVAREIWRDGPEERVLRRRWDAALARLRRQLADLGLRPDLVRIDGHGHVELVLAAGETAVDET